MSYIVDISLPEISCLFQMFTFVTFCCSPHICTSQQKSSTECLIWCQSGCVRILQFDRLRGFCHSTVSPAEVTYITNIYAAVCLATRNFLTIDQYRECTRARSQSDCSIQYGRSIVSEVHPKYVRNFQSFRSFRTLSEVRALFLYKYC